MNQITKDITIIGGGMVGSAFACALGNSGYDIALINANHPKQTFNPDHIDIRVSALTQASIRFLQALNVWNTIKSTRAAAFHDMHVWDATGNGNIHFNCDDLHQNTLGYIVENCITQTQLWEKIEQFKNITPYYPTNLTAMIQNKDHVNISLDNGTTISSRLIVGADGSNSMVRKLANIQSRGWPYQQTAIVATVKTEHGHQNTAWQRFLPTGPLAFLPLHDDLCSIVWSNTTPEAERIMAMDDTTFCLYLEQCFASKLGTVKLIGQRGAFPLSLKHSTDYTKPGIALIGDAAHTIHPLAGQGVNLGFLDAATLAQVLIDEQAQPDKAFSYKNLRKFERWRKGHNLMMMGIMDGFKRLFSNEIYPVMQLRNFGLNSVDRIPVLKQLIMEHAMGLKGDFPDILLNHS